jgi:hypothetical protein
LQQYRPTATASTVTTTTTRATVKARATRVRETWVRATRAMTEIYPREEGDNGYNNH